MASGSGGYVRINRARQAKTSAASLRADARNAAASAGALLLAAGYSPAANQQLKVAALQKNAKITAATLKQFAGSTHMKTTAGSQIHALLAQQHTIAKQLVQTAKNERLYERRAVQKDRATAPKTPRQLLNRILKSTTAHLDKQSTF